INLVIVGGSSILAYYNKPTVFTSGPAALMPQSMFQLRNLIVVFLFCMLIKFITDIYLKTKSGLLLRASGDNQQYVVSLGKDPGNMKILGLMIGNAFTALAGCVLSQQSESADVTSGTGMVVMGLASVIIGINIFSRFKHVKPTLAVILGAIVYKACLMVALQLGLPANYMKLLMAVLFTV
ncbi:MAG TPA: ABC transporter permease, partial [Ruminococcaceae bacterium]|nr:ABC transporter permease [Oscillospiraceae bacterium]